MTDTTKLIRAVRNPYNVTVNIKSGLFVLAILIIFGVLWYTQHIVELLRDDSRHIVKIYTNLIGRIGQEDDPNAEYSFLFDEVIKRIDFPIVNTDADGNPLSWRNIDAVTADTLSSQAAATLRQLMAEMDAENEPVPIKYENTILGYIHYDTDTNLIRQLEWLPFVEILVVGSFILIGYIGFSNIKRSEQRSIWIGMAKETAHQLGTPVSSMMGWIELMHHESEGRESMLKILREMEVDLQRIDRVVSRFSQIGSTSELKRQPVVPILQDLVEYFRKRVPQLGKRVTLEEDYQGDPSPYINPQLLAWVVENVIKNAVDAIEDKDGLIRVTLEQTGGLVILDIKDNGRGIALKDRDNVFRPGYSTKKRGWGLGLSLARRIIEDYHRGRIFVKESRPGEGTTIRIQLKDH